MVSATPIKARVNPVSLIVWSPTVTSPVAGDTWVSGENATVTWDTSDIPAEKEDSTGMILLGYNENNSENLNISNPLALNFPINAGTVTFTVPDVTPKDNYFAVLFGDSGNASPEFSITAPSDA
ncbi:uncharacterized protein STEHIDRAFT_66408 [Stereum hirsutum FP-91666 SS1]|uniref:uncharacterized protein n=1 Tax=Stereum hirsutum (strain FP-91666) TaxID=721885 RepID=UPI000444A1AA|nr:uncharacterized protein STEHIDRAFT_66408 [Stereum hirsutum FP-91666 SS1]EIM81620.1 hypothetical protein STEHIDRAFT_66408 [Stereum hirsutum FP-91666 SS1]